MVDIPSSHHKIKQIKYLQKSSLSKYFHISIFLPIIKKTIRKILNNDHLITPIRQYLITENCYNVFGWNKISGQKVI